MKPLRIGTLNFEWVLQSELPVLLVFGGMWDEKSRAMYSQLEGISKKYDGKLRTGIVDIDYAPDIFWDHDVFEIPTIIIFEDGKIFDRKTGRNDSRDMIEFLNHFYGVLPY